MKKSDGKMKTGVVLLFGGKSAEHDISIISALQAGASLDRDKYDVYPVYITKDNEMFYGEKTGDIKAYRDIDALLRESRRVVLSRREGRVWLSYDCEKSLRDTRIAPIDVALPVVHGTNVEDGTLQGYLGMLGLPYAGCDVLSSAVGMDKYVTKILLRESGIPVLDCVRVTLAEYKNDPAALADRIEKEVVYPMIIKPINCGSSIGITKANDRGELEDALADAFTYSDKVLVERAVLNLREINCSVIGDGDGAEASECEEPVSEDSILSFNDKYISGSKGAKGAKVGVKSGTSSGMASLSRKIPAPITDEQRTYIRETSVKAFAALGCGGVARIDYLMDGKTGEIFFNEINTIPGSLSFYLWKPLGLDYPALLDKIIALALKRERAKRNITFTFSSSVLAGAKF